MIVGVEVVWCGFMNGGCVISFEFGIKDLVSECIVVILRVDLLLRLGSRFGSWVVSMVLLVLGGLSRKR